MYIMTGRLRFPAWQDAEGRDLEIRAFSEVHIETSFKQYIQFAEITLPRNVPFFDKYKVRELFRRGDPVIVELGYNGQNDEEFRGYITQISADIPIKLRVEDEMWKVWRQPVNFVSGKMKLADMLKKILPGYEVDALEIEVGPFRYPKTYFGAVLEDLQSEIKLYSYFIGKKLVCGKYYAEQSTEPSVYFNLERNCVSSSLNYKNKEDIVLKIEAIGATINGNSVKVDIGQDGGNKISLNYKYITVRAELEKKVMEDYDRATRGGFDGSFTAFGWPRVDFGKKAELDSIIYPDRNGIYFIEGVNKTFNSSGYRQEIKTGGLAKQTNEQ